MREARRLSPVPGAPFAVRPASGHGLRRRSHPPPRQIQVPPRLDLKQYGRVGLDPLHNPEKAKGDLDQVATMRFSENLLDAQPGVEVLEFGSADSVRKRLGEKEMGAATAQALGASRRAPVVFVGHLKMSNVTPSGGLHGLSLPHVRGHGLRGADGGIVWRPRTGGTLWRSSGTASRKIGGLKIVGGEPSFSAKDPNKEYAGLVYDLVDYVTRDMRPTWYTE